MTMNKYLLAALIATAPIAATAQSWDGGYVGVQLGSADIDVDGAAELEGDGTSVGIFAGFNVSNGGLVYGAEIDYDTTDYEIADGAQEVDSTTRLKGRIGTELGGGLAYGVAGFVAATSPGLGDDNGYLFGLGYDFPVYDNIFVGAELLQHQFEDYNDSDLDVGVTTIKARVGFNF